VLVNFKVSMACLSILLGFPIFLSLRSSPASKLGLATPLTALSLAMLHSIGTTY